jgi:hypothetical protein
MYTNPSLADNDIPHKSTMAAAVGAKVEKLDIIDINALCNLISLCSPLNTYTC